MANRPPMAVAAIRHAPPAGAAVSRSEAVALARRKRPLTSAPIRAAQSGSGIGFAMQVRARGRAWMIPAIGPCDRSRSTADSMADGELQSIG